MRPNLKCHTPEELHRFWLERDLYIKGQTLTTQDDGAIYMLAYVITAGIVWTFVGLVFFMW